MSIIRKLFIADEGAIPLGRTQTFRCGTSNGIAYNDAGIVKAYINRCTHMGGPVELILAKQVFRCRWHQAEFDPKTGEAIQGEAPQGTRLTQLQTVVEEGKLYALLEIPDDPFSF